MRKKGEGKRDGRTDGRTERDREEQRKKRYTCAWSVSRGYLWMPGCSRDVLGRGFLPDDRRGDSLRLTNRSTPLILRRVGRFIGQAAIQVTTLFLLSSYFHFRVIFARRSCLNGHARKIQHSSYRSVASLFLLSAFPIVFFAFVIPRYACEAISTVGLFLGYVKHSNC